MLFFDDVGQFYGGHRAVELLKHHLRNQVVGLPVSNDDLGIASWRSLFRTQRHDLVGALLRYGAFGVVVGGSLFPIAVDAVHQSVALRAHGSVFIGIYYRLLAAHVHVHRLAINEEIVAGGFGVAHLHLVGGENLERAFRLEGLAGCFDEFGFGEMGFNLLCGNGKGQHCEDNSQ